MTKPRHILEAAVAADSLSTEAMEALAKAKNTTPLAIRTELLGKVYELARNGDAEALRMMLEKTSGCVLGPIDRIRSARRLARRVEKTLGQGLISIAEAAKLTQLVKVRRELELDDLNTRLSTIEATVVARDGGG
jgi:hypothetical protein